MTTAFINLAGGFGNQLFQAALGVALRDAFGADVFYFDDDYRFDQFGRKRLLHRLKNLDLKTIPREDLVGLPLVRERDYEPEHFGELLRMYPKIAFEGYFQNERFFLGRHEAIKARFQVEVSPEVERAGQELGSRGTIGIHLRRSEYGFLGLASVAYYLKSIAEIRQEVGPLPVACFTDEPIFCRTVFENVPDLAVYAPNIDDPIGDFHLLSSCSHYVIANSSFSWWAAWLGQTEDSIVYAPAPWSVMDPDADPAIASWRRVEGAVREP